MPDDMTALTVLVAVLVIVGVVLLGVVAVVVRKLRVPFTGAAAVLGSLAYLLSPVDAVPEIPLGPMGLLDDLVLVVAGAAYAYRVWAARRRRGSPSDTGPRQLR